MLVRFDPFRELDRLADQAFRTPTAIPMDAVRTGDNVVLHLDLPGVDADAVDVEVDGNMLTVTAERGPVRAAEAEVLAAERRHGTLRRQITLGDSLDGSRLDATLHDGVLRITIPVAETAKPRKVAVSVGTSAAIDAQASDGEAPGSTD
jgi:HSP20 family protein